MNAKVLIGTSLFMVAPLVGCATAEESVAKQDAVEVQTAEAPETTDVLETLPALGIDVEADAADQDWGSVLSVQQVSEVSAEQAKSYAFADVEGNHPCLREDRDAEKCAQEAAELAEKIGSEEDSATNNYALSEIQALTPNVVDPQTFDPTRTAQDLGRSSVPQTQVGQALGFQLLQPPVVPEEAEPEDPANPTGGDLPPIPVILDGQ